MKTFFLSMLLIGFSVGANAARLDLDSHHSNHGHHHAYGHYSAKRHDDSDDVFVKHAKHHWHPHHIFALIANKDHHDWNSSPFCQIDKDGQQSEEIPSAVPVPAAVWLFGSATLGLLGFKRKRG